MMLSHVVMKAQSSGNLQDGYQRCFFFHKASTVAPVPNLIQDMMQLFTAINNCGIFQQVFRNDYNSINVDFNKEIEFNNMGIANDYSVDLL